MNKDLVLIEGEKMNLYIGLINNVIDHIEDNITSALTLKSVSEQFHFSAYHFARLFKVITGISVKQYILGRKLAVACDTLVQKHRSVTDTAFEFGFEYPEVFSRTFKKQLGVSPTAYKTGRFSVPTIQKLMVVERDIVNTQGTLALRGTFEHLDRRSLQGVYVEVDEGSEDFEQKLQQTGESFFGICQRWDSAKPLYTVVNCHEDESGQYTVFFGEEDTGGDLQKRIVPEGWYACFHYYGELLSMRSTFVDDYYRWMMIEQVEPLSNGVGMINVFDAKDRKAIRILVPVKPK